MPNSKSHHPLAKLTTIHIYNNALKRVIKSFRVNIIPVTGGILYITDKYNIIASYKVTNITHLTIGDNPSSVTVYVKPINALRYEHYAQNGYNRRNR